MKAMLLAAGRGERLRPLTDATPKPLLRVGGRSLIDYHLQALARAGFEEVVINLAHLGEQIRHHVGDGAVFGVPVRYSQEPEGALETAGGLRHALPLLGEQPFAAINADIWTDYPYERLARTPEGLAHLVLVDNPPHHPDGDFALLDDGRVANADGTYLTFAGIGVYRGELIAEAGEGRAALAPVLRAAAARGQVTGERHAGRWVDVGTLDRLKALARSLGEGGGD